MTHHLVAELGDDRPPEEVCLHVRGLPAGASAASHGQPGLQHLRGVREGPGEVQRVPARHLPSTDRPRARGPESHQHSVSL